MKNYNKILEAVNRGIQLALDDFDDEEQVQNVKSKQVYNRDYTKEYLDLMKEVVDLGLPSGTLWCKYNLGDNSNQLSKAKDWYGKYYAWGELKPNKAKKNKIYFDWDNYKFGKEYNKLTKYCNDSDYGLNGFTDNLTQLLPEDDAAYQFKKCPNKIKHNPKDDGGIKGLNGRVFEGKNGNQLFIPAAGYCYGSDINEVGSDCILWSSSLYLDDPSYAYYLYFNSDHIAMYYNYRCIGYSVCLVC